MLLYVKQGVSNGHLYGFLFAVLIDEENECMVLSVHDIRVSRHKDAHPEDSDGP